MGRTIDMCSLLMDYLLGEMDDVSMKEYQKHLLTCDACMSDYNDLKSVYMDVMTEDSSVSANNFLSNTKSQTLIHAFSIRQLIPGELPIKPKSQIKTLFEYKRLLIVFSSLIACLILFIAYVGHIQKNKSFNIQASSQNQIKLSHTIAYANSKGTVNIENYANQSNLDIHVSNVPIQSEFGCYEVWGIKDGKRSSLGEFVVDQNGEGSISVKLETPMNFDRIEITLEPKWGDKTPEGPSVLAGPLVSL